MDIIENIVHESEWMRITERFTPSEIENSAELDIQNAAKEVEIDIEGTIGGSMWDDNDEKNTNTKEKMKKELRYLSDLKAKKITVNINSLGGSFNHAISIHDLLASNKAHVITKLNGMSASASTIIAQAGNDRQMSENALLLIHRASVPVMDNLNSNKLQSLQKSLEVVDKKLLDIYEKRSGKDRKELENLLDAQNGNGIWIDSKQAKEYGLIDDSYEPMKIAAFATVEQLINYKLPIPEIMAQEVENKTLLDQLKNFVSEILGAKKEIEPEKVENVQEPETEPAKTMIFTQTEIPFPEKTEEVIVNNEETEPIQNSEELIAMELRIENEKLQAKIAEMEIENTKLQAKGTKIPSNGVEYKDESKLSETDFQLLNDLKSLRAELSEVRY